MREHLRAAGVEFDDRNVRHDPAARAELEALTGSVVVPVLVHGDRVVPGYDPETLDSVLHDHAQEDPTMDSGPPSGPSSSGSVGVRPPGDALEREQLGHIAPPSADLRGSIERLLERTREEYAYSVAKGDSPYHAGMRDGLRYAVDALDDLLRSHPTGSDESE